MGTQQKGSGKNIEMNNQKQTEPYLLSGAVGTTGLHNSERCQFFTTTTTTDEASWPAEALLHRNALRFRVA